MGLSADLFDTNGLPMFGDAPLSLFSDLGLASNILRLAARQLPREALSVAHDMTGLGSARSVR